MVSPKRLNKLSRPAYRHSYLKEMVTGWVIHQIKALRDQRDWSQSDLGEKAGKPQSAIARLESETYGNWNTNTLLEIARAFDVALQIRFVSWPKFMQETDDSSPEKMAVPSFSRTDFLLGALGSTGVDQSAPSPNNAIFANNIQSGQVHHPLRSVDPFSLYSDAKQKTILQ